MFCTQRTECGWLCIEWGKCWRIEQEKVYFREIILMSFNFWNNRQWQNSKVYCYYCRNRKQCCRCERIAICKINHCYLVSFYLSIEIFLNTLRTIIEFQHRIESIWSRSKIIFCMFQWNCMGCQRHHFAYV